MTPPFPFAGPVPSDAVDPVSILPNSGPATSPVAVIRSGDGAFSSIRYCEFCDAPLPHIKRRCCGSRECLLAMDRAQVVAWAKRSSAATAASKVDRAAQAFAGLSFTDDRGAAKREPFFMRLPEPTHSPCGNSGAMCESARRT